jgi:hypothetical protein
MEPLARALSLIRAENPQTAGLGGGAGPAKEGSARQIALLRTYRRSHNPIHDIFQAGRFDERNVNLAVVASRRMAFVV